VARVNVYLPEDLAREWREAGLNISRITQNALERELALLETRRWLQRVTVQRGWVVSHQEVLAALREDAATAGGAPS
jgi:post-segregation antitoxin (ccd killing protein)